MRLLGPGALLFISLASSFAQMSSYRVTLDGEWHFKPDSLKVGVTERWYLDSLDRRSWQKVRTPGFWEEYPGMASYDGWGWFSRQFIIDRTAGALSVHFAGVDDDAVVWVNNVELGGHSGATDPFALELGSAARPGVNTISILVRDSSGRGGLCGAVTVLPTNSLDDLLKSPYFGTPALKSADWVKDAAIYSVYVRSASPEGNFAGLEKRLPELKDLGVTVLWLLPIHPVGVKNRKGGLGSPYAVRDYYGINPEFGTMEDFKHLLAAVHRNGMKVIIDMVANHTAWDSRLILAHPEWFSRDARGNIVSPNADWTDVADLDYSAPGLRRSMLEMLRWWVKDVGIDGFRCDVAEMVPTDFWEEARAQLNKIKPVMMLSEGSLPEHHVRAFDLTYAWNTYDILDPLLQGKRPVTLIDNILKNEQMQFPLHALRMRFTTNHDKNAWDSPAVTKFGVPGLKLATVLVNTLPGVPMMYTGEEVANDRVLSLFEKVGVDWTRPRVMGELWKSLFALRRAHKALSRGDCLRVPSTPERDVYAFVRAAGSDKMLVVLNFSSEVRTAGLDLPMERIFPREKSVKLKEVFTGKSIFLTSGKHAEVPIEGKGYRVYALEN
jgi:glycosidase